MKLTFLFVLLSFFSLAACDRNTEERQGYRQEMEESTAPNDYTTGKDEKEIRQTPRGERPPVTE